jgi:hypothetical protein
MRRTQGILLLWGALIAILLLHPMLAGAQRATRAEETLPTERIRERPPRSIDPDNRLAEPEASSEGACDVRLWPGATPGGRVADAQAPRFAVKFQDEVSPLPLVSAFVMPGAALAVEAVLTPRGAGFSARSEAGVLHREGPDRWTWTAPERSGVYDIEIREASGNASCLRVFVMLPYDGSETFRSYRIGRYEPQPLRGNPVYRVPTGLVEVTAVNRDTWLSPHFQLHQFECKQPGDYPRYLVLTTRLLLKLESMLEAFRNDGIAAETLFVMSGYRTPHYNHSIGNQTRYTRHAYGDAADVFIDENRDGRMDDLDGDGDGDAADAQRLYHIVNGLADEPWYRPLVGGLALYGPKPHRGPFIHVDARGARARW